MAGMNRSLRQFALVVGLTSLALSLARIIYTADQEYLLRFLAGGTVTICLILIYLLFEVLNKSEG